MSEIDRWLNADQPEHWNKPEPEAKAKTPEPKKPEPQPKK